MAGKVSRPTWHSTQVPRDPRMAGKVLESLRNLFVGASIALAVVPESLPLLAGTGQVGGPAAWPAVALCCGTCRPSKPSAE